MVKDKTQLNCVCENFIKYVMEFYDLPSLAVGVYAKGNVFTGAGGFRNYITKAPAMADTVYHSTSVSKLFTAAGIMTLVDKGRLKVTDRLVDILTYLPIVDKRWNDITIAQMMNHTSGIPDLKDYEWEKALVHETALKEYVISEAVAGKNLLWSPEEGNFRYSNIAYDLLGMVVSEVSGRTFEEYIKESIFAPAGMDNTTFLTFGRTGGNLSLEAIDAAGLAMPHKKGRDRNIVLEEVFPYSRHHGPSSTLTSTAEDLMKFAEASMKSVREMIAVHYPQNAPLREENVMGWFVRSEKKSAEGRSSAGDYILAGHEGSDYGFRTSLWICPDLELATVILCNITDAPLKTLSSKLFYSLI